MGLRVLIAATCLAVLAFVGHYFWRDYQQQRVQQQIVEAQVRAAENEKVRLQARKAECDKTTALINDVAQGRAQTSSVSQLRKDAEACVRDLQRLLQIESQDFLKKVTKP